MVIMVEVMRLDNHAYIRRDTSECYQLVLHLGTFHFLS